MRHITNSLLAVSLFLMLAFSSRTVSAHRAMPLSPNLAQPAPQQQSVSAFDLILAMNTLRVSLGNNALIEDPTINAVAQATADIMAANQLSWHIGDVSGRIQGAGFGGGSKVFATENFAMAYDWSIDQIMVAWADEQHMFPATNPAYCYVGAGVSRAANGMYYYVLQAAYVSGKTCGEASGSPSGNNQSGGKPAQPGVSQIIVPVKIAEPDEEGRLFHVVQAGQSLWAIAVAYQVTIDDITKWNNISREAKLQMNQKLYIPGPNTAGYMTPTPVGWVQVATPHADGSLIHVVQPYNTLSSIAQAYQVSLDQLLALNSWNEDWPLQIGQELIIKPSPITPTATPRPLTPIERLTPQADGKFYHVVSEGENLSWIADYYGISIIDLKSWNALTDDSVLYPEQKLLLQVTKPATATFTPGPPTTTPSPTRTQITVVVHTPTPAPAASNTPEPVGLFRGQKFPAIPTGITLAALLGAALLFLGSRKPRPE